MHNIYCYNNYYSVYIAAVSFNVRPPISVGTNVYFQHLNILTSMLICFFAINWYVSYHIAGKFGGHKVRQIHSSKDLVKESLANQHI